MVWSFYFRDALSPFYWLCSRLVIPPLRRAPIRLQRFQIIPHSHLNSCLHFAKRTFFPSYQISLKMDDWLCMSIWKCDPQKMTCITSNGSISIFFKWLDNNHLSSRLRGLRGISGGLHAVQWSPEFQWGWWGTAGGMQLGEMVDGQELQRMKAGINHGKPSEIGCRGHSPREYVWNEIWCCTCCWYKMPYLII